MPKNDRPKIVITLRGADTYMKPWLDKGWRDFYKNYGQNVDAFITMTNHQKNYMLKWGIPLHKIHVIPISYGHPFQVKEKEVNLNTIQIISAFRMCWEKNIEGNLRVIKHLKEKGFAVNYQIYGHGQDENQVPYLIDKYSLSDCVKYHGSIKNQELKEKLKTSDFYLQLSHSESLGMSMIEAQTHGLPAIVSNSDGLPEAIIHEETGFCVKPYAIEEAANLIVQLWQSPKRYSEFSKAAIENSQASFSVIKEVDRLSTLYQALYKDL
jgi:glycosyltransferase involved in cell wall biosynthesis